MPSDLFAQAGLGLHIVVIGGENAVNIIQQKTAVAPLIEVRDRNNLPVPGAVVTFAIQGGHAAAFAGGAPTFTVATNAAGQAAAAGFSPLASGAVQINVSALVQGQTIAATITQTNVMTAAQAAAAAGGTSAGGATGGASGAAAGGSGGISAMTIGIVGAAVGGGAIAATQLTNAGGGKEYTGTFAGQYTLNFSGAASTSSCARVHSFTGTLTLRMDDPAKPEGKAQIDAKTTVVSSQCAGGPQAGFVDPVLMEPQPLVARSPGIGFDYSRSNTFQDTPTSPPGVQTVTFKFDGEFMEGNSFVQGTLVYGQSGGSSGFTAAASLTMAITLR